MECGLSLYRELLLVAPDSEMYSDHVPLLGTIFVTGFSSAVEYQASYGRVPKQSTVCSFACLDQEVPERTSQCRVRRLKAICDKG